MGVLKNNVYKQGLREREREREREHVDFLLKDTLNFKKISSRENKPLKKTGGWCPFRKKTPVTDNHY